MDIPWWSPKADEMHMLGVERKGRKGVQGQETQREWEQNTRTVPRISAQEWGRRKLSKTAAGYFDPCFVKPKNKFKITEQIRTLNAGENRCLFCFGADC